MTPALAQSLGIQVIWQDLALFDEMTVAENIGFQHAMKGKFGLVDKTAIRNAAEQALARLGSRSIWIVHSRNFPLRSARSSPSRAPGR